MNLLKEAYDELIQAVSTTERRNLMKRIRDELNKQEPEIKTLIESIHEPKPMTLDPTKPVQLRNGQPAVILEVMEGVEKYPIFGRMQVQGCAWLPSKWTSNGQYDVENYNDHSYDLINVPEAPEKAEFWVNVYQSEIYDDEFIVSNGRKSKEKASSGCAPNRFACIKISCTKGEGL